MSGEEAHRASKERIEAGLRSGENEDRPWYCRSCGKESDPGRLVPDGWYSLTRHNHRLGRPARLGVYCSIACIREQLPRLEGIEAGTADGSWRTSPYMLAPTPR